MPVEVVEPPPQDSRVVPCRIRGDKYQFHLIDHSWRQFLQSRADIRHVHRTLVGAVGITEKKQRDRPLGSVPHLGGIAREEQVEETADVLSLLAELGTS